MDSGIIAALGIVIITIIGIIVTWLKIRSAPPIYVPPPSVLGSNSNFIIESNCNPITGLNIKFTATKDIVSSVGFSEQINAYSQKGALCAYQQYGFLVDNTGEISVFVDNWPVTGNNLLNYFKQIYKLPTPVFPNGYSVNAYLITDTNGNITEVDYTLYDDKGTTLETAAILLSTISGFQTSYLAPITAFEVNVVGPDNGQSTVFSSIGALLDYKATSQLIATATLPSCTETTAITAETANDTYGQIPNVAGSDISQSVSQTTAAIIRKGNLRKESLKISVGR